ncbi:MAG TPA: hypothetical protein VIZ30_04445 [Pseudomonadales bacterium]
MTDVTALINLERYPLERPSSQALRDEIETLRASLRATGAAEAPAFLSESGLACCLADAQTLASRQYKSVGAGTAYLEEPAATWPEDHPRATRGRYSVGVVAYDQFPSDSAVRRLYESAPVMAFVSAVLERAPLFHYADPLGALNLAVMGDGDELQWHYDQTDFVVSLALRDADVGGDFEVAPKLRCEADENYPGVARVLNGVMDEVTRLPMTPGTLLIFAGRHSLHRVSRISGPTERLVALFGYDTKPGTKSTPHLQRKRYGRVA